MVTRHRATLLGITASLVLTAILIARFSDAPSAQANAQAEATARIVTAAQAVIASVDAAARAKLVYPFDSPQKTNWSNLPSGIYQRNSLKLGDLTATQQAAVMKLLSVALSADGYRKAVDIMNGDEVLAQGRRGRPRAGVRQGRVSSSRSSARRRQRRRGCCSSEVITSRST